ncbi:MAG: hypothetical protein ABSA85_17215 [Terracidiphilus sp.]|jgi:hypothetical protein
MLHKTAQERYDKLKRVFRRLMGNFNRDDLDDYVQTANSLREWIQQDRSITPEQKKHLERFIVSNSLDWQICHQIANAQKHVRHQRRSKARTAQIPKVTNVQASPGGAGLAVQWKPGVTVQANSDGGATIRSNLRVYGAGEEITIECDGRRESALAFVIRSFQHFHYIFEVAALPVSQRQIPNLKDILGG